MRQLAQPTDGTALRAIVKASARKWSFPLSHREGDVVLGGLTPVRALALHISAAL